MACIINQRAVSKLRIFDGSSETVPVLTMRSYGVLTIKTGGYALEEHYDANGDFEADVAPTQTQQEMSEISIADAKLLSPGDDATLSLADLMLRTGEYENLQSTTGDCASAEKLFKVEIEFVHDGETKTLIGQRMSIPVQPIEYAPAGAKVSITCMGRADLEWKKVV